MATWVRVKYKCARCGAEDTETRLAEDSSPIPMVLNCWKCGAGRGLDPSEMAAATKGMFPVAEPVVPSRQPQPIRA